MMDNYIMKQKHLLPIIPVYISFFIIIIFLITFRTNSSISPYTIENFDTFMYANLKRRPDRNQKMEKQLDKFGIEYERLPAYDGKKLNIKHVEGVAEDIRHRLINEADKSKFPQISHGGVGLALTFKDALKRGILYQDNIVWFEDDAVLCKDFDTRFSELKKNLPPNWDLIYMGYHTAKRGSKGVSEESRKPVNHLLFRPGQWVFGMVGLIISPKGAQKLLKMIYEPLNHQIDYSIDQSKINSYAVYEPLVWTSDKDSDVQYGH